MKTGLRALPTPPRGGPRERAGRSVGGGPGDTTASELAQLGMRELCAGWRGCVRAMAVTSLPNLRLRVAHLRALYLNELQRRNPVGYANWATRDPSQHDPEPFLTNDMPSTTTRSPSGPVRGPVETVPSAPRYLDRPVPVQVYHASAWRAATAVAVRAGARGEQVLVDIDEILKTRLARWVDRGRVRENSEQRWPRPAADQATDQATDPRAAPGDRMTDETPPAADGHDVHDPAVLRREVAHLHEAIASRAVIEQAKGMLMVRFGMDADEAFALLVRWSQETNTKLHAVATTLIDVVRARGLSGLYDPGFAQRLDSRLRGEAPAGPVHGQHD